MNYKQVVAHFGTPSKVAQALGINRQNVHAWRVRKRIPPKSQLKLEILSGGTLKADPDARKEAIEMASYARGCSS